jgi:hypothetical protein
VDEGQALSAPVGLDQLAGAAALPAEQGAGAANDKPPHPRRYEVETVLGDKQVVRGFY